MQQGARAAPSVQGRAARALHVPLAVQPMTAQRRAVGHHTRGGQRGAGRSRHASTGAPAAQRGQHATAAHRDQVRARNNRNRHRLARHRDRATDPAQRAHIGADQGANPRAACVLQVHAHRDRAPELGRADRGNTCSHPYLPPLTRWAAKGPKTPRTQRRNSFHLARGLLDIANYLVR